MNYQEHNNRIFSKDIETYKTSGLRDCEEYLVEHYFKGPVLVLGCGAGRTLGPLRDKGFDVVGIDLNEAMVDETRKMGFSVFKMNATDLDFLDEFFGTVFFPFHGIDYVYPDIYAAVREAERVIKPGGYFIMSSHNRLFIKQWHKMFTKYADYHGLMTYRTTPFDGFRLRKYFSSVETIYRISISKARNWKDRVYQLMPWFSKSTYFICKK